MRTRVHELRNVNAEQRRWGQIGLWPLCCRVLQNFIEKVMLVA
jgi:hypothetical protein